MIVRGYCDNSINFKNTLILKGIQWANRDIYILDPSVRSFL